MEELNPAKPVTPEIVKSKKILEKKSEIEVLRDKKGRLLHGHPLAGRKLGSKNKMTLVKEQLGEACLENDFKGKFAEMLNSPDKNDRKWAMDKAVILAPKETLLDADVTVGLRQIIIERADEEEKDLPNDAV